jgi:hypothetical protein
MDGVSQRTFLRRLFLLRELLVPWELYDLCITIARLLTQWHFESRLAYACAKHNWDFMAWEWLKKKRVRRHLIERSPRLIAYETTVLVYRRPNPQHHGMMFLVAPCDPEWSTLWADAEPARVPYDDGAVMVPPRFWDDDFLVNKGRSAVDKVDTLLMTAFNTDRGAARAGAFVCIVLIMAWAYYCAADCDPEVTPLLSHFYALGGTFHRTLVVLVRFLTFGDVFRPFIDKPACGPYV